MWGNPGSKHCQMAHISKKFTVKTLSVFGEISNGKENLKTKII